MEIVISAALGALFSWLITSLYSRKTTSDAENIARKLSYELKKAILDSNLKNISVIQLNDLIKNKTELNSGSGVHRYAACPKCGSSDLTKGFHEIPLEDSPSTISLNRIKCNICEWEEVDKC